MYVYGWSRDYIERSLTEEQIQLWAYLATKELARHASLQGQFVGAQMAGAQMMGGF